MQRVATPLRISGVITIAICLVLGIVVTPIIFFGVLVGVIDLVLATAFARGWIGGSQTIESDVRWIAATNRDLERMVAEGRFREDLYHRISVFPVRLPPLRERPADVIPLARRLLQRIAGRLGRPEVQLEEAAYRLAKWMRTA